MDTIRVYNTLTGAHDEVVLASEARAVEAERDALVDALRDIAEPLAKLQREADQAGGRLDGHAAVSLANDAEWLKELAKDALSRRDEEGS